MKKQDQKDQIIYNEEGINQITNQITGAYASGVVDEEDGQYDLNDINKDR
ncbi:hypothetical protein ACQKCU_15815 [Heyndrickxia sporothermodurans]